MNERSDAVTDAVEHGGQNAAEPAEDAEQGQAQESRHDPVFDGRDRAPIAWEPALASAPAPHRRMSGLPENHRRNIGQ